LSPLYYLTFYHIFFFFFFFFFFNDTATTEIYTVGNTLSLHDALPISVSPTDKTAWAQAIVDKAKGVTGVTAVNVSANHGYEWRYFASSEGSYIEQELYTTTPTMSVTAKVGDVTRTRNYPGVAAMGGWE